MKHEVIVAVGIRWCLRQRRWFLWQNDSIARSHGISIVSLFSFWFLLFPFFVSFILFGFRHWLKLRNVENWYAWRL